MKKILALIAVNILVFAIFLVAAEEGFAKCEAEKAALDKAIAEVSKAIMAHEKAVTEWKQAHDKLLDATRKLNAVAAKLGAEGGASTEKAVFIRTSKGEFLDKDPEFKAAKKAWQEARVNYQAAHEAVNETRTVENVKREEYVQAQRKYNQSKKKHEPVEEKPKKPEKRVIIDTAKKLSLKLPRSRWIRDGEKEATAKKKEKGAEVAVAAKCTADDIIKIEVVSDPPGMLKIKDAKLTSPEGVIYTPSQKYDKKRIHLGRPVYTGQRPTVDSGSGRAIGALIGTGLTGGKGTSDASYCPKGGGKPVVSSGPDYVGLGTGLVSSAMSQAGRTQAAAGRVRQPIEKSIPLSVAEFKCQPPKNRIKPWLFEVDMQKEDGSVIPYTFDLYLGSLSAPGGALFDATTPSEKIARDEETAARNKELAALFKKQAAKDRKQAVELRKKADKLEREAAFHRKKEKESRDLAKKIAHSDVNDPDKVEVVEDRIYEAEVDERAALRAEGLAQQYDKEARELEEAAEKSEKRVQELEAIK